MKKWILFLVAALLAFGTPRFRAVDPVRYDAPNIYTVWWQETLECLDNFGYGVTPQNRTLDLEWFGAKELYWDDKPVEGRFVLPRSVYLLNTNTDVEHKVKHEMAHYQLGEGVGKKHAVNLPNGESVHPFRWCAPAPDTWKGGMAK